MAWNGTETALHTLALSIPLVGSVALGVGLSLAFRYTHLNRALEEQVLAYRKRYPLTQSIQELELQKGDLESAIKGLESTRLDLERQKGELQAVNEQLMSSKEAVAAKQKLLAEIDSKLLDYERLRVHYDAITGEIEELKKQRLTMGQEVQNMGQERQALESELRRLAEEFQKVEERRQELNTLQQQLATIKEELLEKDVRKNALTAEVEALESRLAKSEADVGIALETLKQPLFTELPALTSAQGVSEDEFLNGFEQYLFNSGFYFHPRLLKAFHTALKCQDISSLVVLAGISGTGKSELPQLYATYANLEKLVVPVQPRWDSPQDLLGFYNYMERQYKPTALVRALRQYAFETERSDRLLMILLDEMNLARVEYYFSDFLSKLEARRHHADQAHVELDFGNLAVAKSERVLPLSSRVLFVGTMNEDESTQTLSDKVLDRASVLTFPRPRQLRLTKDAQAKSAACLPGYLSVSMFETWSKPGAFDPSPVEKEVEKLLHEANGILAGIDRAFGHRVSQGVLRYVLTYPGVLEAYHGGDPTPMWHAISDQLAQKVVTKLRGVPLETANIRVLQAFEHEVLDRIQDPLLRDAYRQAYDHGGHAFNWKGMAYEASLETTNGSEGLTELTRHV